MPTDTLEESLKWFQAKLATTYLKSGEKNKKLSRAGSDSRTHYQAVLSQMITKVVTDASSSAASAFKLLWN